jgi:tetratricopeptide (TPR) repeat protein
LKRAALLLAVCVLAVSIAGAGRIQDLLQHDHWQEALAEARAEFRRLPGDPGVTAVLAEAMFRAGLFEEAEPLLEGLEKTTSPPPRALMVLARLRGAQGRGEEAVELMERAVAAAPADRTIVFWAADHTRSRPESVKLLERYLELAEGDDPDRIAAAKGSLGLYRELGDRPVWIRVQSPERLEVPLVPVRTSGGDTVGRAVKVRLGKRSKPVKLLLDTGSGGLFVDWRAARKCGFEPLAEETVFGGGGGRRHRSQRGLFDRLALGDLQFEDVLATTSERRLDSLGRYQGIIGIAAFEGYRVTLDLARDLLVLDSKEELEGGSPYWNVAGQMLVRAATAGEGGALFLFDTGATSTVLARSFAERIEGAELVGSAELDGFGGAIEGARWVDGVEIGFQDLRSGTVTLPAVDLSLRSRLSGVEISGYLGMDLLGRSTIVIDTRTRRISVAPPASR